jgi:hypothetical protein
MMLYACRLIVRTIVCATKQANSDPDAERDVRTRAKL